MGWRRLVVAAYLLLATVVIVTVGRRLGTEIFPKVDAGQFQQDAPDFAHVVITVHGGEVQS